MKILKILIPVVVVGGLAVGGYLYYQADQEQKAAAEMKAKEQLAMEQKIQAEAEAEQKRLTCTDSTDYYVISRDRDGGVGEDILVKTKIEGFVANCKYEVADGDFEVKNSDPEYFKTIQGNLVITDIGTGPSGRGFRVYDITKKEKAFGQNYFGEINIGSSTVSYLAKSNIKADAKNCKDYKTFMKDFGNAVIVTGLTLDLETLKTKDDKKTSCLAVQ